MAMNFSHDDLHPGPHFESLSESELAGFFETQPMQKELLRLLLPISISSSVDCCLPSCLLRGGKVLCSLREGELSGGEGEGALSCDALD
eukprot:662591-Rhodomonas_salina.1